ncbi:MAG: hypothetical protein ACP6KW_00745 [Candidatus Thorarchaeota archaeon]
MRKSGLLAIFLTILFIMPTAGPTGSQLAAISDLAPLPEGMGGHVESADYSTGVGSALSVLKQGVVSSSSGTLSVTSSRPGVSTLTLEDGWTGTGIDADIGDIRITVDDVVQNSNLNSYHNEKFVVSSSSSDNADDVKVPDEWTLEKNVANDGSPHPLHGDYQLRSSNTGYGGTRGAEFKANLPYSFNHTPQDEVYISQMVSTPYREIYSVKVSFMYRVASASDNSDKVYVFSRFFGVETKFHVFESGDPTDTWLEASVTIPESSLIGASDYVSLLDVGLGSDLDGIKGVAYDFYVSIDDVVVSLEVRPFPEQIDLRVNGSLVWGSTAHSIYPYLPDDADRDCWDYGSTGIDLDGYNNDGRIEFGIWSSSGFVEGSTFQLGLQFPVDIPKGAIVTAAYIEMEASVSSSTPLGGGRIYVADEDNVTAFTNGLPHLEDRYNWVETSEDWILNSWILSPRTRYKTDDLTPLVQSVISRSGWTEGNFMCFMVDYMYSSTYQQWNGIKGSAGYDGEEVSRLFVEYIVPRSEDTVAFFDYQKDLTIDHTKVDGDLTDFPVLVDIWDSDLHSHVRSDGRDIAFVKGDTPLDFEIESFDQVGNGTHAHLVAWVKVPNLSSSSDTTITMLYGSDSAPPPRGTEVWEDYEIVQHMNDNGSSFIQFDSTANNHDGTPYGNLNGSGFISGKIGPAVNFDGVNDLFSVGQIFTDDWGYFTMSAWVNHSISSDDRIFSKAPSTSPSECIMHLAVDSTDLMRVRLSTDGTGGTSATSRDSITSVTTTQWHFLTWTWNSATDTMWLYVDGSPDVSYTQGGDSVLDSDLMFIIGNWQVDSDNTRHWHGAIDEIRMRPSVVSDAWVSTEYNNQYDPSSFLAVSAEQPTTDTWTGAGETDVVFTVDSPTVVQIVPLVTMDVSGVGQTLNSDLNPGTDYYIESGSTIVNWTAKVMISPPAGTTSLGFTVEYPAGEWKPTTVINPMNEVKILGSDWWYRAGSLQINRSSIDFWGMWTIKFISMNYVENVQMGKVGEALGDTAIFNINDQAKFMATTPTWPGATVGFVLTDPTGTVWYTGTNTTSTNPSHKFPSFRYHKDITISSSNVYEDVVNFPVLLDFLDTDLHDSSKVRSDGSDIMFAIGTDILPHEIEYFNQNYNVIEARLVAWVSANLSSTTDTTITMYYGSDILDNLDNPDAVWAGSEAVYHLGESYTDETSGGIHYDSTEYSRDAVQYGNSQIGGIGGYGQDFDGTNDQILAPDTIAPTGDTVISGWFYLDSSFTATSTTSQLLIEKYLDDENDMHIGLAGTDYNQNVPNGSLVFKIENGQDYIYKWTTITAWSANTWYNFFCILDASNPANNKIYINGQDRTDAGSLGSSPAANLTFSADWGIGGGDADSQFPSNTGWLDGRLDEVRITSGTRSAGWIRTEETNQRNPNTFAPRSAEVERASPDHSMTKTMDSSAPAGLWTVSAYYNGSGTFVTNKTGLFERTFIVRHDSTLTLNKPTDAVGDRVTVKTAGDTVIVEYELKDSITSAGVTGATVTMNWTSPSTITLDEYGGGRYGTVLDTDDLGTAQSWRIEIQSYHQYYNNATEHFNIELYHSTNLDYTDAFTTPVGQDFNATLNFVDTYDGTPIVGATITFDDGSPVNVLSEGGGSYYISIDTSSLSVGSYTYTLNATKAGSFLRMASVDITVVVREHYTVVSVTGDMTIPYGQNLDVSVVLLDLDTGTTLDIADVVHFNFTTAEYGSEIKSGLFTYDMTLTTNTWDIGTYTVTLRVPLSSSDYYQPDDYQFEVTVRKHRTSMTVSGVVTQPYGNVTPLTVIITDLDTGSTLSFGDVSTLTFTWPPSGSQVESSLTSLDIDLDTSTWAVGTTTVTLQATLSSAIYETPANYVFLVTIRAMSTVLYHDPASLVFPQGVDFSVDLRLNVSEAGQYYGDPIQGRVQGEFSVTGYTISIDTTDQAVGRYTLTIDASNFGDGYYEITVWFISNDPQYADTFVVISFRYRPVFSSLSSPNFPQVTTPYLLDVAIILNYTDYDFGSGIEGATITSPDHPELIANWTDLTGGIYRVWIDVSTLAKGTYYLNLTADKSGYDAKSLEFRVVVREAYTSAIPSVGSMSIPIGDSQVFYVDFTDTDRLIPINNASSPYTRVISTWGNFSVTYEVATDQYKITFYTSYSDSLQANQLYSFTFMKENYKNATFTVSVTIRTHNTDFRLVSSIEPKSTTGTFEIHVYYGDLDSGTGVRSALVQFSVHNDSGLVVSTYAYDDVSGDGYYTIYVDADQFGLGVQTFTVYADWTGTVAIYEDKNFATSASVVGRESALTLLEASDPTAYNEDMSYVFFFSDSGTGISNLTGNVFIYVTFPGETVTMSGVIITDLSATQPGNYSIQFNTNIFDRIGLIYMNVFVNWSKGVAPYYTNRTDTVSVRVLARDTLLSISPPSPESYGELAQFTFTYEDIVGTSVLITDDPKLTISMNVTFSYSETAGTFTVTINTSQFSRLGLQAMTFDITWVGAPFYANRTGRIVFLNVLARQTSLEYLAPAPTQYLDEVVFNVTWTDITGGSSVGIGSATLELFVGGNPVDSAKYSYIEVAQGVYEVTLNTTFASSPGTYALRVELSQGDFWILDVDATRDFNVRERITLLSSDPLSPIPHNASIHIVLYYQDLFTSSHIANTSGEGFPVHLEILTSGTWYYTVEWKPVFQYYLFTVETWNKGYAVDTPYTIQIRMSYASQSPYYASDDLTIEFQFRNRGTTLSVDTAPETTAYGFNATLTVLFSDDDASGAGIDNADITVLYSSVPLVEGTDYVLTRDGNGYYTIEIITGSLGGLGSNPIQVLANWTLGVPYYSNATLDVNIILRERETNIEITTPPSQTKYLDDVVFTFVYNDLDASQPITTITQSDVTLWFTNGTQIVGGYTVLASGQGFELTINSTLVTGSPQTGIELRLAIDWDGGVAPYYADQETIVRFSVVGRNMFVEPDQIDRTPDGDILTITFRVTDVDTDVPVSGAIILFSCQNDTLNLGSGYFLNEVGGVYTITVDTNWLTQGTGNYLFDIAVHWDPLLSPFYANKSVITLTGLVDEIWTSIQAGAPQPSSAQISETVSVQVTFRDLDHGQIGISLATILVEYLPGGSVPLNLAFVETATPGVYDVSFSTADLGVGTHQINITALRSGYAVASVQTSFTVTLIQTSLQAADTVVTLYWTTSATVIVSYNDILHTNLTSGATVEWTYGSFSGAFVEVGSTGNYSASIDTTSLGAGTRVLTITAQKDNFATSVTTVTLVIISLPSQVVPSVPTPLQAVLEVSRGDTVPIDVWLNDTFNDVLITDSAVTRVYITFQGTEYEMVWNGTTEHYQGQIPGVDTRLNPGSYDVRITATFPNYDPSSYSFKILLLQTRTQLEVFRRNPDGTFTPLTSIAAVYTENVTFYVNFTAPSLAFSEQNISAAYVNWVQESWGINVNFTHYQGGMFVYTFNTVNGTWGTTGLTFRAFPDDPVLASASVSVTITISEIQTEVLTNFLSFSEPWGWSGNLTFFYNDTSFNRGITNATVTYQYGGIDYEAVEFAIGNYSAFINTTLLKADTRYSILITFSKPNFEERRFQVEFFVEERPVSVTLSVPEMNWINNETYLMQVPMGDILNITVFYEDISDVGGLGGGVVNATVGAGSGFVSLPYFPGVKNITLVELGGGYYYFLFDTNDLSLYENLDFVKTIIPGERFRFTIRLVSANREDITFNPNIMIVPIPTEIEYDVAQTEIDLVNGEDFTFEFTITDTWHGVGVEDFEFEINQGATAIIVPGSNVSMGNGVYRVVVRAVGYGGDSTIRVTLTREFYDSVEFEMIITTLPNNMDVLFIQMREVYLPIGLVIVTLIGLYVRIWSVPKRIRQMNGQIKALGKGKMPKAVPDVKSRQELIADLFNDTQSALAITRTPEQMPPESVPIEVPEMGELLIQLAILTNLSADELEEFKADISKMKISEQAAFVKEVIMQEAIRAARRDGKTVEETLEEVRRAASRRLAGEEAEAEAEAEAEPVETVFLTPEEPAEEVTPGREEVSPAEEVEEVTPSTERMSPYEIEELRRDLERHGVPPYEIENIVEQAKNLPRELVDELVKSLGIDRK